MKEHQIAFSYTEYPSREALPEEDRTLLEEAIEARKNAYAPYSRFKVGAAVRLNNGEYVIGSNQENASFPSGLCAERVAVFQAGARFPGIPLECLAISAVGETRRKGQPAAPCGNCRQSIYEYEFKQGHPIRIILQSGDGPVYILTSVADLLPLGFDNSHLAK